MIDPELDGQLHFLRGAFRERKVTLKQISSGTGVHVSQVSRILAGKVRRASTNVRKICKFASLMSEGAESSNGFELLLETLKAAWDGTPSGAKALGNILLAVRCYRQGSIDVARM